MTVFGVLFSLWILLHANRLSNRSGRSASSYSRYLAVTTGTAATLTVTAVLSSHVQLLDLPNMLLVALVIERLAAMK